MDSQSISNDYISSCELDDPEDVILVRPVSNPVTDMDDFITENLGGVNNLEKNLNSRLSSTKPISQPHINTVSETNADCGICPVQRYVQSILYWRKPLVTAIVFTVILIVELSFTCLSAISFIAYIGLLALISVNLMRMYRHFIAKTNDNLIPYLECEISLSKERTTNVAKRLADMLNNQFNVLREILLITDPKSSIKFAITLYLFTYIGAHVNFLTLFIMITFVTFLFPKLYENYKSEIDKGFVLIRNKCNVVASNFSARIDKLPFVGHKTKTQ